jgi:hypothetical protein
MHHVSLGFGVLLAIVALLILCFLVDRILLRLERKGWVSYRTLNPSLTARSAMRSLQEIVQPEVREVEEEKRQRAAERDESESGKRD